MLSKKQKDKRISKSISVLTGENAIIQNEKGLYTFEVKNAPMLPIPAKDELESRFSNILASIDLKNEKKQFLEEFSDDKKWHLICVTENVTTKEKPEYYINAFKAQKDIILKQKVVKSSEEWNQKLVDLEISLRTNSIEWVKEFLKEENDGLEVLIWHLDWAIDKIRQENEPDFTSTRTKKRKTISTNSLNSESMISLSSSSRLSIFNKNNNDILRLRWLKMAQNDIHYCILCLKAIMNHKHGFEMAYNDEKVLNSLVFSLLNDSQRTRTFVLDLIAGLCLVDGGHSKVMDAFENFKKAYNEKHRFQYLLKRFTDLENFDINFMTACMRCINLLVHSPQDMNYRVYLQHKFYFIGLNKFIQELRQLGSEDLNVQLDAYEANNFNVGELVKVAEKSLSDESKDPELAKMEKKFKELENTSLEKLLELEAKTSSLSKEKDLLKMELDTLRIKETSENLSQSESKDSSSNSNSESKNISPSLLVEPTSNATKSLSSEIPPPPTFTPPPPSFIPPPPPPPGPPPGPTSNPIVTNVSPTVKNMSLKSRNKLPSLNWTFLTQSQVKDTVYAGVNEDHLYKILDLNVLEENFKLSSIDSSLSAPSNSLPDKYKSRGRSFKPTNANCSEAVTLLDVNRQRNIEIARKKLSMPSKALINAIENMDLQQLNTERLELILRLVPSEQEVKLLNDYQSSGKPLSQLTDDEQFLMALLKVERLTQKLKVISFLSSLHITLKSLTPQVQAILAASVSVKKSKRFAKLMQMILAVGNYLNSRNKGGAYGFKLQCLEMINDTKSSDRRQNLLHYIVTSCKQASPDLLTFDKEFNYVEKASLVSLENISLDFKELQNDLSALENEIKLRSEVKVKSTLQNFFKDALKKVNKLKEDYDKAEESFRAVASYYGENPKTTSPNVFFGAIVKFTNSFKEAEKEVEMMKQETTSILRNNQPNNKLHSNLNSNINNVVQNDSKSRGLDKKTYNKNDMEYGTFDGIIRDLKNEPFLRVDAYYRSRRQ